MEQGFEFQALEWIDLRDELKDKHLRSFSLSHDGRLLVLADSDGQYGSAKLDIYEAFEDQISHYKVQIPSELLHFGIIQSMPDEHYLLVSEICQYRPDNKSDRNGLVYSKDGHLIRSYVMGDCLKEVHTTSTGDIWVNYREEGVYGVFDDWNPADEDARAIGGPGLNQWNLQGKLTYSYRPPSDVDYISDCFALNVTDDNTAWVFYAGAYRSVLARIENREIVNYWFPLLWGSSQMAIDGKHILFYGVRQDKSAYYLGELTDDHQVQHIANIEIKPKGQVKARGNAVVIFEDGIFYRFTISDLWDAMLG